MLSRPPNPWVITLDNVLTDKECDRILVLTGNEFTASVNTEVGDFEFDGVDTTLTVEERRTSSTFWIVHDKWDDPFVQSIVQKMENITLIPGFNSEFMQALKYEPGDFYVNLSSLSSLSLSLARAFY